MTNNILIPKKIFEQVQFDESSRKYGHEDTLFGIELKQLNIPIQHIDNPIYHDGLESTEIFLQKNRKKPLKNLVLLIKSGKIEDEIKLYSVWKKIHRSGLAGLYRFYCRWRKKAWRRHLFNSSNPSLRRFDLYKLCLLDEAIRGSN